MGSSFTSKFMVVRRTTTSIFSVVRRLFWLSQAHGQPKFRTPLITITLNHTCRRYYNVFLSLFFFFENDRGLLPLPPPPRWGTAPVWCESVIHRDCYMMQPSVPDVLLIARAYSNWITECVLPAHTCEVGFCPVLQEITHGSFGSFVQIKTWLQCTTVYIYCIQYNGIYTLVLFDCNTKINHVLPY